MIYDVGTILDLRQNVALLPDLDGEGARKNTIKSIKAYLDQCVDNFMPLDSSSVSDDH